ncbi:helix-turn-helix domain protein [Peptococcaceae bacterium CEB3]|nr:helix-turn-helix domain protein [Peptococcaceae bacterium CEB3]
MDDGAESLEEGLAIARQLHEAVVTIISKEARISEIQLAGLKRALNSIRFEHDKEGTKTLLSTGDVAKKLGVSNQAVINWIENGKMKAFRSPGGHYRIPAGQFRTTEEEDSIIEAIFERLWAKRQGMPAISQDDLGDL